MNIKSILRRIRFLALLIGSMMMTGCSNSDKPAYLEPHLITTEATHITRTEATLNGSATIEGETEMPKLLFRYGTSESMNLNTSEVHAQGTDVSLVLTGLKAGTTYYYMLQGNNGRTTTTSNMMSFTTQPNGKPSLTAPQVLSYGPCSIIVGFDITANGGEEITETGCYYDKEGNHDNTQQKTTIENYQGAIGQQQVRLNDLQFNTTYRIWTYAKNRVGETKSESITFKTTDAVKLQEAGKLSELMGNHLYEYAQLTIAGYLNGDDFACLRTMAGRDINNKTTTGKLTDINMADAHIVAGGSDFGSYHRHTENQVIGQGLFAHCSHLKHIILPSDVIKIEKDAFTDCTSLKEIEIPASVNQLLPSSGCTALETILVSKANTQYSSLDGVLFNGKGTEIIWFPMENKATTPCLLPSQASEIMLSRNVVSPASTSRKA